MCQALFKELLTWIILLNNLSRCIYITHTHTDLNIYQRALMVIKSFNLHNKPMVGTIITPIFQMRKSKHRQIEQQPQGHTAHK